MPHALYEFLERDHARLDELLNRADASESIDEQAYEEFRHGLLRHIAMEEKVLLPEISARRGGEPLAIAKQLRADHAALGTLLVLPPSRELIATIRTVLEEHNPLEEDPGGLYEVAEQLVGAEVETLVDRMRALPPVKVAKVFDSPRVRAHLDQLLRARRAVGSG